MVWAIKFSLWPYFVVDKGLGPVRALKASSRTTYGVKAELFGFQIICMLIMILGYICLVLGVLAAYPITLVASALVYRHLLVQTPELAELGIVTTAQTPEGFVQAEQATAQPNTEESEEGPGRF